MVFLAHHPPRIGCALHVSGMPFAKSCLSKMFCFFSVKVTVYNTLLTVLRCGLFQPRVVGRCLDVTRKMRASRQCASEMMVQNFIVTRNHAPLFRRGQKIVLHTENALTVRGREQTHDFPAGQQSRATCMSIDALSKRGPPPTRKGQTAAEAAAASSLSVDVSDWGGAESAGGDPAAAAAALLMIFLMRETVHVRPCDNVHATCTSLPPC